MNFSGDESVTAPVEQTLRLLEEPKKEIQLQVKEKDLSIADVLERTSEKKPRSDGKPLRPSAISPKQF